MTTVENKSQWKLLPCLLFAVLTHSIQAGEKKCMKRLQPVKILSELLIKTSADAAATFLLPPTLDLFLSQCGSIVAETQGCADIPLSLLGCEKVTN